VSCCCLHYDEAQVLHSSSFFHLNEQFLSDDVRFSWCFDPEAYFVTAYFEEREDDVFANVYLLAWLTCEYEHLGLLHLVSLVLRRVPYLPERKGSTSIEDTMATINPDAKKPLSIIVHFIHGPVDGLRQITDKPDDTGIAVPWGNAIALYLPTGKEYESVGVDLKTYLTFDYKFKKWTRPEDVVKVNKVKVHKPVTDPFED
jgi:hypothetical protein